MRFALRGIGLMVTVMLAVLAPIFAFTTMMVELTAGQTGDRQSIVMRKFKGLRGAAAYFRLNDLPGSSGGGSLAGAMASVAFCLGLGALAISAGVLIAAHGVPQLHAAAPDYPVNPMVMLPFMGSVTLVEAAKLSATNGETKRGAVIAMFAQESQWLASLPFKDIPGNAYGYNREGTLPGVAFRGVNESYTESTGIVNPLVEALRIGGGDLDVDIAILKTQGESVRATHESMKAKALAAEITRVLIKGDSTSQPREFDGLQNRIVGAQLIDNGATSGGDALSLAQLDALIDQTAGPSKVLWMNKKMRRRITQASRSTTVGGFIESTLDDFGRTVYKYNNVPILVPYEDNGGTEPLDFLEANPGGGGAASTSIYCLGLGEGYTQGIQNGVMDVRDLGELQTAPVKRTRVEWLIGLVVEHGRAAARLRGIKDAAVVA